MGYGEEILIIRSYDGQSADRARVEDLERRCEVGPSERVFLFTDTMGDPICRIRNSPLYKMLVAEVDNQIVGVIQGSIKIVTVHQAPKGRAKVGYVLGLRVVPMFRRRGIGCSLVRRLEEWFAANDVDYTYMATEKDNEASVKLFINKLGYTNFRVPAILVNPVKHYRPYNLPSNIQISRLKVDVAEFLYGKYMASTEFFPHDIDRVLKHKLSLGTWVAYYKDDKFETTGSGSEMAIPKSWAMLSVWNSGEVFKLRLGKAPLSCLIYTESSKVMDKIFPCLKLPSIPDFYEPFGFYFMYGVHREGAASTSGKLVRALCQHVHNMAAEARDCKVIVTEIGGEDALREEIPHWKLLSCPEDLWCIKALKKEARNSLHELTKTPPTTRPALFVDPREV
ncbi:probable N-acetyltransferase HLS1 [Momordica charantia]|uniref:Probable N-acetyltransferase HLS1 n=1 Tax=Momordica charantia TaxID=3673 RepID=A0A6J1DC73_MOMCH|nr:probable N-acetyltransferase HLS1 [Momordica charantia]